MKRTPIPNTDLSPSALCYGVMRFGARTQGQEMFDLYRTYTEAGGNFFDTAHSYACWYPNGSGCSERALGECLRKFGHRDQMVVMTKGAMPGLGEMYPRPNDVRSPEMIDSDISDSLQRLQLDHVDIYTLHRDDTRFPAGEIIETLNDQIKRGRTRYIGASNWTVERLTEANDYAAAHGLQGFVVSSPQWTLGHPNRRPYFWDGSEDMGAHMTTEADIEWHHRTQLAIMPWTPTAYGFFDYATGRNPESFDNEISRARRERAKQLGEQLGATASRVSMAWLIAHDFPVFPIVGTTNMEHLKDSIAGANLTITTAQRDWLTNG